MAKKENVQVEMRSKNLHFKSNDCLIELNDRINDSLRRRLLCHAFSCWQPTRLQKETSLRKHTKMSKQFDGNTKVHTV